MSIFAQLNEDNVVIQVCPIFMETPEVELNWLQTNLGGRWVETSDRLVNGKPFRVNPANIGMTYDETRDAFIGKKHYPSWVLNEETLVYYAPIPRPTDDKPYRWDEQTFSWKELKEE